ncbi:hypothetical protein ACFQGW_10230 [Xanthomonas theicola]|uniref:hypothetical protein n=1 Tax=Xanthomonas theicola TaxID=56464 RepID=UPI00361BE2A2
MQVAETIWAEFQPVLQADLQRFVKNKKRLRGQASKIEVRATCDDASSMVLVDLGEECMPRDGLNNSL